MLSEMKAGQEEMKVQIRASQARMDAKQKQWRPK
jgi:hypothetical protein